LLRSHPIAITPNFWAYSPNNGEFGIAINNVEPLENNVNLSNYRLVFSDEFDAPPGSTLDAAKWDTGLLWGPYFPINNEEQLYVDTLGMHSAYSQSADGYSPFVFTGDTLKIVATATGPNGSGLQPPPRPPEDSPDHQL